MLAPRILIYGNAGSGKTTLAHKLSKGLTVARLPLDSIAWGAEAVRRPIEESVAALKAFIDANPGWVIEGCYGDLVEAALPRCTELHFLNPGVEVCIANSIQRPWDPEYCASPEDQQRYLAPLHDFIRQYATRQDEYGLTRHRAIFDGFTGFKREYTTLPPLSQDE
jgi:adenylate kinase family enzyme